MTIPHVQYVITLSPNYLDNVAAQLEKNHSLVGRVSAFAWGVFFGSIPRSVVATTALSFSAQYLFETSFPVAFSAMITTCGLTWYNNPSFVSCSNSKEYIRELKKLYEAGNTEAFWKYALANRQEEVLNIPQFGLVILLQLYLNQLYAKNEAELSKIANLAAKIFEKVDSKNPLFVKWGKLMTFSSKNPEVVIAALSDERQEGVKPAKELLNLVGSLISS